MQRSRTPRATATCLIIVASLAGCGGDDGNNGTPVTPAPVALACDNSITSSFKPDANTTVLLVKAFKQGDPLLLSGTATATTPIAANDLCVVKLNVGPGHPGPADALSTSPGIGIEIWLPAPVNWNSRIHVFGGGGWAGGNAGSITALAGAGVASVSSIGAPAVTAGIEGAVSATTDTGHTASQGSFAMNPDGTINTTLWNDFSVRGIHEMAVKTKALTLAYYGKAQKFAYWDGFSTGGRQGHKEAQENAADFDGILAGAPAFNWTRFITSELYPQIVYQRDLAGVNLTTAQLTSVSNAANAACDVVGGQHLNYVKDPSVCRYDPTTDASVLCTADGGTNATAACVTPTQATVVNKIWYGQTRDGSVPSPVVDNSWSLTLGSNQLWYGLTRGASLTALAGATPFTISSDITALELQNPTIATPSFVNATGNGADGWKALTYAQLANATDRGTALQPNFANINTDNPDLSAFRDAGHKMLMYHGLADVLIMPQGSVQYYNRVATAMGGIAAIQSFYRFYLVPGMQHGLGNGSSNTAANPPLPAGALAPTGGSQLYGVLTEWVEKGIAPTRLEIASPITTSRPTANTAPLCLYPLKANYTTGDPNVSASYTCA
ncbi:MAG: tannase/feruloyl esterase family alpha/beta hydrolase [Burkholderiaceae bacterium]